MNENEIMAGLEKLVHSILWESRSKAEVIMSLSGFDRDDLFQELMIEALKAVRLYYETPDSAPEKGALSTIVTKYCRTRLSSLEKHYLAAQRGPGKTTSLDATYEEYYAGEISRYNAPSYDTLGTVELDILNEQALDSVRPKDRALLAALIRGDSITEIAADVGVSTSQLHKRRSSLRGRLGSYREALLA